MQQNTINCTHYFSTFQILFTFLMWRFFSTWQSVMWRISPPDNLLYGQISPHDNFFLHGHRPWCPWQIWGMLGWSRMVSDGLGWSQMVSDGLRYFRLLHGIWWHSIIFNSLRFPLDIPKITPRFPQDFPKISQRFPQDFPKISPRFPIDFPKISWSVRKISLRFPLDFP